MWLFILSIHAASSNSRSRASNRLYFPLEVRWAWPHWLQFGEKAEESICGSKALGNLFIMRSGWCCVPRVCLFMSQTPWEKFISGLGPNPWEDCRLQQFACNRNYSTAKCKGSGDDDERLWLSAPSEPSNPPHPCDGWWHRARRGGEEGCCMNWDPGRGHSNYLAWGHREYYIMVQPAACFIRSIPYAYDGGSLSHGTWAPLSVTKVKYNKQTPYYILNLNRFKECRPLKKKKNHN